MGKSRNAQSRQTDASARTKLSLHPLSLDEALAGAMATGRPSEPVPHNKHAKRTAARRRLEAGAKRQKGEADTQ
jgi:hypothetical protein